MCVQRRITIVLLLPDQRSIELDLLTLIIKRSMMQKIIKIMVINIQVFILVVVDKSSSSPDIVLALESVDFKCSKIFLPKGEGRIGLGLIIVNCHVILKTVSFLVEYVHASDIQDIE